MIYKVITGRLFQHEAFENLVGDRLFPVVIPLTRPYPAVSYNVIVATPDKTKDLDIQDTVNFQIDIYSKKYDEAYSILEVVRDRLNHFNGQVNNVQASIRLDSFRDDEYNEELGVFRVIMDFSAKIKL